jgi:inositol 1,4,5-triphosphate receptor type 1/inositol 1,4,5-triphosphate receptor type 3
MPEYTNTENIFVTLGTIMIVCSLLVVLFFLCKKAPLLIQKAWGVDTANEVSEADKKKKLKTAGAQQKQKKTSLIRYAFGILEKSINMVLLFLKTIEVLYYVAYGFAAFLGVWLHPFFFAFHLTEIILRFFL